MKKITLYSTPMSIYYNTTKEFLNEKKLVFDIQIRDTKEQIKQETGVDGDLQIVIQEQDPQGNIVNQSIIQGLDKEQILEKLS